MATVIGSISVAYSPDYNYEEELLKEAVAVDAIKEGLDCDGYVGEVIQFPIADNYAQYLVASMKPVRLYHLTFGDGYQVSAPLMRGLIAQDIKELVDY